ncbi:MAG TPA: hypothetical protein VFZ80_02580, partial [Acidimicrobiia bacterium]
LRFGDNPPEPMSALILERLKRRRIPRIFFDALTHRDLDAIADFEVWNDLKTFELVADPPVAAQADGESLGMIDGGELTWEGDSLRVLAGN